MLIYSYVTAKDNWNLHNEPIGFESLENKNEWLDFADNKFFGVFSSFFDQAEVQPFESRIGLFCNSSSSWIPEADNVWK